MNQRLVVKIDRIDVKYLSILDKKGRKTVAKSANLRYNIVQTEGCFVCGIEFAARLFLFTPCPRKRGLEVFLMAGYSYFNYDQMTDTGK